MSDRQHALPRDARERIERAFKRALPIGPRAPIAAALDEVPPKCLVALVQREVAGIARTRIADMLGVQRACVGDLIARARSAFRKALSSPDPDRRVHQIDSDLVRPAYVVSREYLMNPQVEVAHFSLAAFVGRLHAGPLDIMSEAPEILRRRSRVVDNVHVLDKIFSPQALCYLMESIARDPRSWLGITALPDIVARAVGLPGAHRANARLPSSEVEAKRMRGSLQCWAKEYLDPMEHFFISLSTGIALVDGDPILKEAEKLAIKHTAACVDILDSRLSDYYELSGTDRDVASKLVRIRLPKLQDTRFDQTPRYRFIEATLLLWLAKDINDDAMIHPLESIVQDSRPQKSDFPKCFRPA